MTTLASFALSRRTVNFLYFVCPPLGLLFTYGSPSFTLRERRVRACLTAGFLLLFAFGGPALRAQLQLLAGVH